MRHACGHVCVMRLLCLRRACGERSLCGGVRGVAGFVFRFLFVPAFRVTLFCYLLSTLLMARPVFFLIKVMRDLVLHELMLFSGSFSPPLLGVSLTHALFFEDTLAARLHFEHMLCKIGLLHQTSSSSRASCLLTFFGIDDVTERALPKAFHTCVTRDRAHLVEEKRPFPRHLCRGLTCGFDDHNQGLAGW